MFIRLPIPPLPTALSSCCGSEVIIVLAGFSSLMLSCCVLCSNEVFRSKSVGEMDEKQQAGGGVRKAADGRDHSSTSIGQSAPHARRPLKSLSFFTLSCSIYIAHIHIYEINSSDHDGRRRAWSTESERQQRQKKTSDLSKLFPILMLWFLKAVLVVACSCRCCRLFLKHKFIHSSFFYLFLCSFPNDFSEP